MYIVTLKLCQFLQCKRYPHYNYPGETRGKYCNDHKEEGMQVVGTLCIVDGCKSMAKYNLKNLKRQYCAKHKTNLMVESGKPICEHNDCLVVAIYGLLGCKPTCCNEHKTETMVDVVHNHCVVNNCRSRASYGLNKEVKYCTVHKDLNMTDNAHTKCKNDGCNRIPCFNFEGQKTDYIAQCTQK
jgi:hypothetical protein